MMVFFMFFGAANVARTILTEDRDGTMPRLFTTPTRHGTIIGGKFVAVFVTVLLQAVVLLIAGRLIFGIDWGRIDAVILLTLVAAGVAGGLALLVISFAKTPAQAGAIGSGIYLVLALLGGNFTGTAQASGTYAVVQQLTPNGWLIEGWDTAMRGGGAGGHPLAGARPARVRGGVLLLRRAQDEEAVRVRLAALIAGKDLRETVRDKLSFIFILVMPLAFTLFFGLLFGGGSDADKLPLAVWDADGGAAAKELVADLDKSEAVRVVVKQGGELEQWMADERAAAGLIIPEGYSDAVASGEKADLTIVATQGTSGASTVASEIRTLAGEQVTVELASKAAAEAIWATRSMPAGSQEGVVAESAKQARPVVAQALEHPAVSTKVVEAGTAAGQMPSGFVLSSPGMMVNFVLFSLMTAGIALIIERQNGTLQRLMTTRLRRWQLIGGKAAGMFLLTFAQQAILIAVAQLFFGVDYLRDPAALLLMMVSLSLVASTLGLLLATVLQVRAGAHRDHGAGLDGPGGDVRRVVPARDHRARRSRPSVTCCPPRGSSTGCAASWCAGSTSPTCCPRSAVSLAWAAGFFVLAVWRFRLSE